MKPNSCLYRAVVRVCQNQFGVDVSQTDHVFDRFNIGEGIPTLKAATAINQALSQFGIKVKAIYCNTSDKQRFDRPDLVRKPKFVKNPAIAFWHDHAEGIIGDEYVADAVCVMTLTR